jgi:hypothetical protein
MESASLSSDSGEASPALPGPNSFHDWVSLFQAFRWLGVVTLTRRASSWSRGLSGLSMLDVSSVVAGGVAFFRGVASGCGCGRSAARRATMAGSDVGRRDCRDWGKAGPPVDRG